MSIRVAPVRAGRLNSRSMICCPVALSRFPVGSSASRMRGCTAKARAMAMSIVVLPEPDGPTMPTVVPAATVRSTPRRMLTGPAGPSRVRCTRLSTMAGGACAADWLAARNGMGALGDSRVMNRSGLPQAVRRWIGVGCVVGTISWLMAAPASAADHFPVHILALGDSLTAGYGLADLKDSFPQQLQRALAAKGY